MAKITIEVKDPDGWGEVAYELGMSEAKRHKYFEFGEYATLELEVEADMTVSGRIVPRR